jgi:zinc transporter
MASPCFVWCYSLTDEGQRSIGIEEPAAERPFRWLHLDLSDQRTVRWLETSARLPPKLHALMFSRDGDEHFAVQDGGIALVVHDFERGLDPGSVGHIGTLHLALVDGMLLTGRYVPLRGATLIQSRLALSTEVVDAPSALAFVLGTLIDSFAGLVIDLNRELLKTETELLADEAAPDTRELVSARRRLAQLHRVIGGLRATLMRMAPDPKLPASLGPVVTAAQPRLAALEGDVLLAQQQLRMLREEVDLQTAQRTNQNVYLLSILTAIMMPATLVTGFFGMNTSGLPFSQGSHGTLLATGTAVLGSAATYWLLRRLGLIRSR